MQLLKLSLSIHYITHDGLHPSQRPVVILPIYTYAAFHRIIQSHHFLYKNNPGLETLAFGSQYP